MAPSTPQSIVEETLWVKVLFSQMFQREVDKMGPVISQEILDFLSLHYFFFIFFFFMTISNTGIPSPVAAGVTEENLLSALCQLCPAGLVPGDGGSSGLLALSPLVPWGFCCPLGVGGRGELPVTGRGPKD